MIVNLAQTRKLLSVLVIVSYFGLASWPFWCDAQVDNEFWFAFPKTHIVPTGWFKQYVDFYDFTPEVNFTATIEQPATGVTINVGLATVYGNYMYENGHPFGLQSYGTGNIDSMCTYNTVSNWGYRLVSPVDIVARMSILNRNSATYLLKGRSALGTQFMIPAQWQFPNSASCPESRNSVEVIATEDGTLITVTPTVDLYGGTHPANESFSVSLNRGQVFCFAAASQSAEGHLGGTTITSNKPVAVDMTDDAVTVDGIHIDVVCDQLLPESEAGTEYVAVPSPPDAQNTYNGQGNDYALIYILEDNTNITVHTAGTPVQYTSMQRGDRTAYHFPDNTPIHIVADKPVLVFQLTGAYTELSGHVTAPLRCLTTDKLFYNAEAPEGGLADRITVTTLLCEQAYINGFESSQFDASNNITTYYTFSPTDWQPVPGTNLFYYRQTVTDWYNSYTRNTLGPFFAVMMDYNPTWFVPNLEGGCRSMHITDYTEHALLVWNATMPTDYCQGDSIFLSYSADNITELTLLGPEGEVIVSDTLASALPEMSGWYSLTGVHVSECLDEPLYDTLYDSVYIQIHSVLTETLADSVCVGNAYHGHGFHITSDRTDSVGRVLFDTLTFASVIGCDSVVLLTLKVIAQPSLSIITSEGDFCDIGELVLTAVSEATDYLWNTGEETPFISAVQSGHYTVTASIGDCRATASTDIPPCDLEVYLPNAITPSRSDGLNDCLRLPEPLIHKTSDFSLSLYNRWGEQVFVTDDPHFIWCGEGVHLSDVYVYVLRIKDMNGKPFVYRGTLTVL